MKFLCRNCKAKYQIADEKVAGRTLRMTCQQCGEPIVVRGPSRPSGSLVAARPVPPAAAAGAAGHGALHGADLAHHMAAPGREPATAHEEWHVAIQDQPVGPLRRDDVARRIAQGQIDRDSLAWREGMDDWLPIKHIAELSALFGGTGPSHGGSGALKLQQHSPTPSTRGDMAPIGGRQMVPAEEYVAPSEAEPAAVAVATVAPAGAEPGTSEARQPGWAQMFALVSGGAFILAAGALLGVRVLAPSNQSPPPPAAAVAPVVQPTAAAPNNNRPAEGPTGSVIELDTQSIDGASGPGQRKPGSPGANTGPAANPNDKKPQRPLTAEQKEMLERMGGGLNQGGPSNLRAPSDTPHSPSGQAGQLTSEQLSAVVLNGRKNLQRCYETALRGANSNETVRLDVDIEVSPHGNVTTVHTAGKGLPGMEECITRTVKMWRFPMSGEATQTHFPVVFQPGA